MLKNLPANAEDLNSVSGLGRSPGGEHGNPLQYSCLENPHGQRSLVGYSSRGHKESDTTKQLSTHNLLEKKAYQSPRQDSEHLPARSQKIIFLIQGQFFILNFSEGVLKIPVEPSHGCWKKKKKNLESFVQCSSNSQVQYECEVFY